MLSASWCPFLKKPNTSSHCFRIDYENDVCRKNNHQGSRFMIESANILEDEAQWRDKTKGLSKLVIENNA